MGLIRRCTQMRRTLAQTDGNRQWQRKSGTYPRHAEKKDRRKRFGERGKWRGVRREGARVVKGTRTNRHRFQWGKIEETLRGKWGIRAELKAGKNEERIHYCMQVRRKRLRSGLTSIAIRKSGIRSRNIERRGLIPSGIKRARNREGKKEYGDSRREME